MSCALFQFELFVRVVLGTVFVFVIDILLSFLFDSILRHFLTCKVFNLNAISKHLLVSQVVLLLLVLGGFLYFFKK